MSIKLMTASVIGSALLATSAFAQSPSTSTTAAPAATTSTTASGDSTTNASYQNDWRSSKVVGLNVYNENNDSLGTINDLLMDKTGKVVAAIVGVGGFLGVGEHYIAVPFEKVKFVNEPVASNTASNAGTNTGGAMGSRPATTATTTGAAGSGMASTTTKTTTTTTTSNKNDWAPDHAMISGTKDQLKAMPEFKYNKS